MFLETDERIELVFGMGASFQLSCTAFKWNCIISKNKGTFLWNFIPNSRLRKFRHGIRYDTKCYFNVRSKANMSQLNLPHTWHFIVENINVICNKCYQLSLTDVVSRCRSIKLTILACDDRLLDYHSDHQPLSTARFRRAGQLADTCYLWGQTRFLVSNLVNSHEFLRFLLFLFFLYRR